MGEWFWSMRRKGIPTECLVDAQKGWKGRPLIAGRQESSIKWSFRVFFLSAGKRENGKVGCAELTASAYIHVRAHEVLLCETLSRLFTTFRPNRFGQYPKVSSRVNSFFIPSADVLQPWRSTNPWLGGLWYIEAEIWDNPLQVVSCFLATLKVTPLNGKINVSKTENLTEKLQRYFVI